MGARAFFSRLRGTFEGFLRIGGTNGGLAVVALTTRAALATFANPTIGEIMFLPEVQAHRKNLAPPADSR